MDIDEYGEFKLIDRIISICDVKLDLKEIGIGDDCSVVQVDENFYQITTTDLLIEEIHFLKTKIDPEDLGKKSIEVNVSDIAAMGGFPELAYLSVAFPQNLSLEYFDGFISGIKKACDKYHIKLMGGDTTRSPGPLVINVLLQGKVEKTQLKLRSFAKPNDVFCIVGNIADSGIGLKHILGELESENENYFIKAHNSPFALLNEARWLSKLQGVHAMIDISDGLASDLQHVCQKSHVGAMIELTSLPISDSARKLYKDNPSDLTNTALCGGEDYSLLLSMSESCYNDINNIFNNQFENKLTRIGIATRDLDISYLQNGIPSSAQFKGFDHFGMNKS